MNSPCQLRSLAVIAPFYNEEANVLTFYSRLCEQLDLLNILYSLVFVDDGSRDKTLLLLNQLADQDSRITVLSLARNFGHQAALTAGLDYADADAVVVMDSDLQHPPDVIQEMIQEFEKGAAIVYAVRNLSQNTGLLKRVTSNGYYLFLERMTSIPVIRGAADFRLMSRQALLALRTMREAHRYLRGMVPWLGFPYAIVYYEQPDRFSGRPSYTWNKSLNLALHGLLSFSTVPLQLITRVGLTITVLSFFYLVYIVGVVVSGRAFPGWASLIGVILIVSGVQLTSIGVLAQYIGMIFEQVKERPLYVLKQERVSKPSFPETG